MPDPIICGVCPVCGSRLLPGDVCLWRVLRIYKDAPSPNYPGGYEKPEMEAIHWRCITDADLRPDPAT